MKAGNEKRAKVLVADDDVDLLQLMQMQLQTAGFEVKVSLNAEGITKKAVEGHPDIILLDISMDGISGDDICKKLKAYRETSNIPIIMISANDNIEHIAHDCGANGFVRKPFNLQNMKDKIFQLIHAA